MVTVATHTTAVEETLQFIETAKATTLLRQLASDRTQTDNVNSQELNDLKLEIDQIREQMRVSTDEVHPLQSAIQLRQKREHLRTKIAQYDALKARLERQTLSGTAGETQPHEFSITQFREDASHVLSEHWVALDYYLLADTLITVMVTPRELDLYAQPITQRFKMALTACDNARRNALPPTQGDLQILGKVLIPEAATRILTPETTLLISPHKSLHQVPWAALQLEQSSQPLVCACIPAVVPSLQALTLLWERRAQLPIADRAAGLLIGLSSFNGLHAELPSVRKETIELASRLGGAGRVLSEEKATWGSMQKIKGANGLSRFAWMHIASHFVSDRQTGRLGRIALRDGDIFLDQLRDLAPLPALVSLSACNSNDSFLYEGDERVDLQTTCFMAGARSVIGHAWPVQDEPASELMVLFYDFYISGMSPAQAAAQAQRRFIEDGRESKTWASFVCAGVP